MLDIDTDFNTYEEYEEILAQVKSKTDLPFYELSYEAWKWSNKKKNIADSEVKKENSSAKYWLYSPGENGHKWDEFYEEGIMGLGWDEIGDLNQYGDSEEIREALRSAYGGEGSKFNDVLANEEFRNTMSIGDVVIAKRGRNELLGYGMVTSDYYYDDEREDFQKCRKVNWQKSGSWKLDFHLVTKTLTDITEYDTKDPRYDTYYQRLLGIMNDDPKDLSSNMTKHPLNTIFYGPPGTGKTYYTIQRAAEITENREIDTHEEAVEIYKNKLHDQIEMITFHQNYSYEDFIQGLRPDTEANGQLSFEKKDGIFKLMADRAMKNLKEAETDPHIFPRKNYVIIIDEINRANISRVFGELITLIEPDKRSGGKIPMTIKLPSGDTFMVPSNLYIIGTMNTADKSIALLDIALRRRFEFEAMYPLYEIPDYKIYDVDILRSINKEIIRTKGHDFQIGHSYFMNEKEDLAERMNKKVVPLLLEYYMNDEKEVRNILDMVGLEIEDDAWPIQIKGRKE